MCVAITIQWPPLLPPPDFCLLLLFFPTIYCPLWLAVVKADRRGRERAMLGAVLRTAALLCILKFEAAGSSLLMVFIRPT